MVCGWSTGLYLVYHIGRFFTFVILKIQSVASRFMKAEETLTIMATNHLPHIQSELEKSNIRSEQNNQVLIDIRGDLRKVLKIEEYE
jgi:hypothetical protein